MRQNSTSLAAAITYDRIRDHASPSVNEALDLQTEARIARLRNADRDTVV